MVSIVVGVPPRDRIELAGLAGLLAFVGVLQVSIVAAGILLVFMLVCWGLFVVVHREEVEFLWFFWVLLVYAMLMLLLAANSPDPCTSFVDSKQLVFFLIVPMVYWFARGVRACMVLRVVIIVGAISVAFGIIQYGLLNYNNLGQWPQGILGYYMMYSGLLLLVIGSALVRLLFDTRDRAWMLMVMPAFLVVVVLTFIWSAWVGTCVVVVLVFSLKDFRLVVAVLVLAAVAVAISPPQITSWFYLMFDLWDPTSCDRVVMFREGIVMIEAYPFTGVGPNMVECLYEQYRDPMAVERVNLYLYNVLMQIVVEWGFPALAVWVVFIVMAVLDVWRLFSRGRHTCLAAAALAVLVGMLVVGLFEYNFGDSEFLMLFLVLLMLPFAVEWTDLL